MSDIFEIKTNHPECVDPTKLEFSFGRRAVPKLVEESSFQDVLSRQKALISLESLLHNPNCISQSIQSGVIIQIKNILLSDNDPCLRQKATEILVIITGHALGRTSLIKEGIIEHLMFLLEDKDEVVRRNIHLIIYRMSSSISSLDQVILYAPKNTFPSLTQKLVHTLLDEFTPIQILKLKILYNLIRKDPSPAFECHAMQVFTECIQNCLGTEAAVWTAQCIMMLAYMPEAKVQACELNTLEILTRMLWERKSECRAAVAGAIMMLTINIEAKRMVTKDETLGKIISLLGDENHQVVLNILKIIANCSEDYRGRFAFQKCLDTIEELKYSKNDDIAKAARKAISVITWRP